MEDITLRQAKRYYRQQGKITATIKDSLRNDQKEIVYGAQSVNVRMPDYLKKFTEDWDVYSREPQKTAKEMETDLDKHLGGNYFTVEPAKHEGTFKVISRVTNRNVADITLPENSITYESIDGINYATLDEQVKNIKKSLSDPEAEHRHEKDAETLQRIRIYETEKRPVTIKQVPAKDFLGRPKPVRLPKPKMPRPPKIKSRFKSQKIGPIYRTKIGRGSVLSRHPL